MAMRTLEQIVADIRACRQDQIGIVYTRQHLEWSLAQLEARDWENKQRSAALGAELEALVEDGVPSTVHST